MAATNFVAFCLRSVKVVLLVVEAVMSSEKVALTLTVGATIVAPALGTVRVTLGGVVSGGGGLSEVNDQTSSVFSGLPEVSYHARTPP